jgi:hypothetical protein
MLQIDVKLVNTGVDPFCLLIGPPADADDPKIPVVAITSAKVSACFIVTGFRSESA